MDIAEWFRIMTETYPYSVVVDISYWNDDGGKAEIAAWLEEHCRKGIDYCAITTKYYFVNDKLAAMFKLRFG